MQHGKSNTLLTPRLPRPSARVWLLAAAAALCGALAGPLLADGPMGACKNEKPPQMKPCYDCAGNPTSPVGASEQCPTNGIISGGSVINNLNFRYRHDAVDYQISGPSGGCVPCGGGGPVAGATLPSLDLRRLHKYDQSIPSLFGPSVGWQFDIWPTMYINGQIELRQFDSLDSVITVTDPNGDGVFEDNAQHTIKKLELYDAQGQLTTVRSGCATAVLTRLDGVVMKFEFFQLSGSSTRYGRLLRVTDRNNTWIDFKWKYGTTQFTGSDRTKSFQLESATDAYLRKITFTYKAAQVDGRWAVERVDLPNGQFITYDYGTVGPDGRGGTNVGLTAVHHPDGSTSTFSAAIDSASQTLKLSIFDPAAEPTHRRKDVYLTQTTWVDPNTGQVYQQASNRIRKLVNGAGEVSYQNWIGTVGADECNFIYEGGGKIYAIIVDGVIPVGRRVKTSFAPSDIDAVPANWNGWILDYSGVSHDASDHRTAMTNASGHAEQYQVDPTTGVVTQTTYPDGSTSSSTFNQFNQPLTATDRLGRVTEYEYDANGNMLRRTAGKGSAVEGTWRWTYNARGQVLTATDAGGNVTDHAYYEATTDPGYRRLKSVTEPADRAGDPRAVTQYEYDAAGRLTKSTDPTGRATAYAYDARNRVATITYADASAETFAYGTGADANLLVQRADRSGSVETMAYDGQGRETAHVVAAGTPVAASMTTTYLTGTNLPAGMVKIGDATSYGYDYENRRVSMTVRPRAGLSLTSTTAYDDAQLVAAETDPYGRRTLYAYDVNDRPTRTVREMVPGVLSAAPAGYSARLAYLNGLSRSLGNNATYLIADSQFDAEGEVTQATDGRGFATTMAYDAQARRTDVTEAAGTTVAGHARTAYDPQGNVTALYAPRHFTESGGYFTTMLYTGRNLLASRTEASGRAEAATEGFTYYLDGRARDRTDFRGKLWTTTWGACCARLQAQVSPAADVDGTGTNKRAASVQRHNDHGDLTHEGMLLDYGTGAYFPTLPTPTNVTDLPDAATLMETTTRYDARHRPVARTVWLVKRGAVDANDPPIAGDNGVPAADGLTTRWSYDENLADNQGVDQQYAAQLTAALGNGYFAAGADGSAVQMTNPEGEVSVTVMDGTGRTVMTIDGLGHAKKMTYDAVAAGVPGSSGSLLATAAADALGHTTTSYADGAGRTLAVKDAIGKYATMGYDAGSNLVAQRDANGVGQDCAYDGRGRRTGCTDTSGDAQEWTFDSNSNPKTFTDAKDESETYAYDARDRKTASTDRNGGVTKFAFDANSNLASIEDADAVAGATGKKTLYDYDARNLKLAESYPGHPAGADRFDPGYDKRLYAYDGMNRLRQRTDQRIVLTAWAYDLAGRMTGRSYSAGSQGTAAVAGLNTSDTFAYDRASRLTWARSGYYSLNTITRSYDAAGRTTAERLYYGTAVYPVTYAYDAADRLTALTYPGGRVATRGYTDRDELASAGFAGAGVVTRAYDDGGRLITTAYANGVNEARTYATGENLLASISAPGVTSFAYGYDANDNRTAETNGTNAPWSWSTPAAGGYDAADRLVGWARTNGDSRAWALSLVGDWNAVTKNGTAQARAHDAVHQLTLAGAAPLAYDPDGNLTANSNGQAYAWDVEDRLVTAKLGAATLGTYAYDALGRRFSKSAGQAATVYVSAGPREVAEYAAGAAASAPSREYVYGDYVDEVLLEATPASPPASGGAVTRSYHHHDGLYSTRALTDAGGAVAARFAYDPYGKAILLDAAGIALASQTPTSTQILFTGRRLDPGTGLQYSRARYYDSTLGCWTSRDPIEYNTIYSLYQYVDSKPLLALDPNGTNPAVAPVAAVLAVAVAACVGPAFISANNYGPWGLRDKTKHCYVTCMGARNCSAVLSLAAGLSREVLQTALAPVVGGNLSAAAADSVADMRANIEGAGCAGWETSLGCGNIGRWFRQSCTQCCEKKAASHGYAGGW